MKLVEVRVEKFCNFVDSTPVSIQPDITCLVGKNESGKTAFLCALSLLNPARPNVSLSVSDQYPAWLEKRDRLQGTRLEEVTPITAVFELQPLDIETIERHFGTGVLANGTRLTLRRDYSDKLLYDFEVDEQAAIRHIRSSLPETIAMEFEAVEDFDGLLQRLEELQTDEKPEEVIQSAIALKEQLATEWSSGNLTAAVWKHIEERIPQFFYYHEYSNLPYSVAVSDVLQKDPKSLSDSQLTARSLLKSAAVEDAYLLNPDYERRKRELENVANAITQDVRRYWTQNPELRVQPDITVIKKNDQVAVDELKIRIWDERHSLSLPFDRHSSGFQWFFSFLAAFSEYEFQETPVVILLDEPALGLHGRAQADFLRFIEERLAAKWQVFYTTHSPFMIQPDKLERVRLIEDHGPENGAKVTQDVLTKDKDTLFPLQGALGYDLAQHLFIAPHNLVVEGTSDYTYLTVISDFLKNEPGRTCLNDRWSVVPVGGADMIPTFVALLGHHLNVTVVVDSQRTGHQRLLRMASGGYLSDQRIIAIGELLEGQKDADVEDLFTTDDYLKLYNRAFGTSIRTSDLTGSDSIIRQIVRHRGIEQFDHGCPADFLLRHRDEFLPQLSAGTLARFEKLFLRINETLQT